MNHEQQVAAVLTEALGAIEDQVWKLYETGKDRAAIDMASGLVTRCKAAADPIDALGQRFLTLLREAGDDEARTWLEGAIAELESDDEAPAMQPSAKVTDSGKMSKLATKDAPRSALEAAIKGLPFEAPVTNDQPVNFLAAVLGADQAKERTTR